MYITYILYTTIILLLNIFLSTKYTHVMYKKVYIVKICLHIVNIFTHTHTHTHMCICSKISYSYIGIKFVAYVSHTKQEV